MCILEKNIDFSFRISTNSMKLVTIPTRSAWTKNTVLLASRGLFATIGSGNFANRINSSRSHIGLLDPIPLRGTFNNLTGVRNCVCSLIYPKIKTNSKISRKIFSEDITNFTTYVFTSIFLLFCLLKKLFNFHQAK